MILVTGASGTLGRELLPRLTARGQTVRALSRRPRTSADGVEWVVGDLATGAGLDAAAEYADVIVHAASDAKPTGSADAPVAAATISAAIECHQTSLRMTASPNRASTCGITA